MHEAVRCGIQPFDVSTRDKSEAYGLPCLWKTSSDYWLPRFPKSVSTCVFDQGSTKGMCRNASKRVKKRKK